MQMYKVDLQPDSIQGDQNAVESEAKGRAILKKAWAAHGVDSLLAHQVYQFTAVDDWQGMMAGMGKLWPQKTSKLAFKYAPQTFDAQLEFLDGETKGMKAGLQAWHYYEKAVDGELNFQVEKNDQFIFGIAAFQYFTEIVGRLSGAELIRFAGEKTFNGKNYDLVFTTWGSLKANAKNDQYLMYINQENHMLEYMEYTIRDNYLKMPGTNLFYGSIGYSNFHNIEGFQVPFTQSVFMNSPSENNEDYLHQLNIESFSFDGFEKSDLYPDAGIQAVGDKK